MRVPLVWIALLLAGCSGAGEEPTPPTVGATEKAYLGGGVVELNEDRWGASLWVEVPANATTLSMELVYSAIASVNPHVHGIPECEWRIFTTYTETSTETVDCAAVVPGRHEVRVEHEGGQLSMGVRVIGRLPVGEA